MARAGRSALVVLLTVLASTTPTRAQGGGDANRGRALFTGATPFRNGGPACVACHDEVALGVPGGGTMGPDLTNVAARMGTLGVATALETLDERKQDVLLLAQVILEHRAEAPEERSKRPHLRGAE